MTDVYELIEQMQSSSDPVDNVVVAIWHDVTGRRGWRQEHDRFDLETQIEIVETWRALAREALT